MCSDDEWKSDEEKQEPANPEVSFMQLKPKVFRAWLLAYLSSPTFAPLELTTYIHQVHGHVNCRTSGILI